VNLIADTRPTPANAEAARAVFSFDVFDTMVTRAVGHPCAVTRIVADRLAHDDVLRVPTEAWHMARQRSEASLVERWRRTADLRHIHEEVAIRLGYDRRLAATTAATELDVERDLSRVVPGAPAMVRRARQTAAAQVAFVSDTPFPSAFIVELLDRAGLWQPGDRCYSSAEQRATKSFGDLFGVVAADLQVPPERIRHVGDSRRGDVGHARLAGWRASRAPAAALNRYEREFEDEARTTVGVGSWLAGASRLARLEAVQHGVEPMIASVAAGVAAPLMFGFASWLLRSARAAGLRRLYFLARDGQVLRDIACGVQPALGTEIDCRYLYVSRRALRAHQAVSGPRGSVTAVAYLLQEGLGDGEPYGLVDVGWHGTTNRAIADVLDAAGRPPPAAHYSIGLADGAREIAGPRVAPRQHGWLFDHPAGRGMPRDLHGHVALIEMFCTGLTGTVAGYHRVEGRIEPMLVHERNQAAIDWGLRDMRWVVGRFAEHVVAGHGVTVPVDLRPAVWRVLRCFWEDPSDGEIACWGRFPVEPTGSEGTVPIAQRVHLRGALRSLVRDRELRGAESWPVGTARRSSLPVAAALHARHLLNRHAARIARIPGRVCWEIASRSNRGARLIRKGAGRVL
jgi:FMN phosphatase YigB (HAD superfamily)